MDDKAIELAQWIRKEWLDYVKSLVSCSTNNLDALTNEKSLTLSFESHLHSKEQEIICDHETFKAQNENLFPDLRVIKGQVRIAIEVKYKLGYGAHPDNRKEAFIDLGKLERYLTGKYANCGLFLWLTDQVAYTKQPTGDSKPYSTHDGRIYTPDSILPATRSRRGQIEPFFLTNEHVFSWQSLAKPWWTLALLVR